MTVGFAKVGLIGVTVAATVEGGCVAGGRRDGTGAGRVGHARTVIL